MNQICIVLCTYNGEKFLSFFLQSLCNQTEKAKWIVAYDDASTDASVSVLEKFSEVLPIKIFRGEKNLGHRGAFHQALSFASQYVDDPDFIALADQDDEWIPNKLTLLKKALVKNPSSALAFGDARVIDAFGKEIAPSWRIYDGIPDRVSIKAQIAGINHVTGCLSLFRASLLAKILPIPEGVSVHDRWIAMLAERHGGIYRLSEAVVKYRLHESNAVGGKPVPPMSQTLKIQENWVLCLLKNAERIPLTEGEIRFAQKLLKLHQGRQTKGFLPLFLPWILKNQNELFLPRNLKTRIRQILFSLIGLPWAKIFWKKS